eukprot:956014-Prorocentrum_minimum.AAC.2
MGHTVCDVHRRSHVADRAPRIENACRIKRTKRSRPIGCARESQPAVRLLFRSTRQAVIKHSKSSYTYISGLVAPRLPRGVGRRSLPHCVRGHPHFELLGWPHGPPPQHGATVVRPRPLRPDSHLERKQSTPTERIKGRTACIQGWRGKFRDEGVHSGMEGRIQGQRGACRAGRVDSGLEARGSRSVPV